MVVAAPAVSVLIPILNEEAGLEEMVDRLLVQTLSDIEIILADGGSTDRSLEIAKRSSARDARVRLVTNPGRLQGAGLNRALDAAHGSVIVRLDGHSFVEPDYIERCVDLLGSTGADVVGGRMAPRPGDNDWARAIALANSRRWGAGPARFHHGGRAGFVETVYLGAFRRDVLNQVGGWSQDVGVNEDFDLNYRIRRAGGRIWYDPALLVGYQPRATLGALARQYFRYGRSKGSMLRKQPTSLLPRQGVPALLVPGAVVSWPRRTTRRWARYAALAYVLAIVVLAEREHGVPQAVRLRAGIAAAVMHWTWSAGFWVGLAVPFRPTGERPERPTGTPDAGRRTRGRRTRRRLTRGRRTPDPRTPDAGRRTPDPRTPDA